MAKGLENGPDDALRNTSFENRRPHVWECTVACTDRIEPSRCRSTAPREKMPA